MRVCQIAVLAGIFMAGPFLAVAQNHLPEPCTKVAHPPPAAFHCPSPYVELIPDGSDEIFDRAWTCRETGFTLGQVGVGCGGGGNMGSFPGWTLPAVQPMAFG